MALPTGSHPTSEGPGSAAASAVSLVPVDPDTSTDVQAGYEFQARNDGPIKKVHTVGDLDKVALPDGGGRRAISVDVRGTSIIVPDGEYLDFTPGAGAWEGPLSLAGGLIQGNVAGGLIRGTPTLARVTIVNLGGPDLAISDPGGGQMLMDRVFCAGPVGAGTITDPAGSTLLGKLAIVGGAGLVITGTIGAMTIDTPLVDSAAPSIVGITIDSGAVLLGDIVVSGGVLAAKSSGQRMLRIDGTATLPTPGIIVRGATVAGVPGAAVFDTSGAGIGSDDIRVIGLALVGDEDSVIEASSSFIDLANPVNVSGGADTWLPIPHIGAGAGFTAGDGQSRFELVDTEDNSPLAGATPATRWGLRFLGPRPTSLLLPFDVSMLHAGGGSELAELRLEYDAAGVPAAPVWVGLTGSVRPAQIGNQYSQLTSHVRIASVPVGARFRISALVVGAPANIDVAAYTITGGTTQL